MTLLLTNQKQRQQPTDLLSASYSMATLSITTRHLRPMPTTFLPIASNLQRSRANKLREAAVASLFDRLDERRPPTKIKQPQKIQHAQRVLNWLLRWPKPYVLGKDL